MAGTVPVPSPARALGRQLLAEVLRQVDLQDQIPGIDEMSIAAHRTLIESLPFRVYIYTLGSFMGDMDFESILESRRPRGAVFDAFEIEIESVRCGFYIYSLQPISERSQMQELWMRLRAVAGWSVKTAKLPEIHTEHHARMTSLEGDPDEVAANLIQPHLPKKFLDEIALDNEKALAEMLANLLQRAGRASIEKDELIRFVERNRNKKLVEAIALLRVGTDAAKNTDDGLGILFSYVLENVEKAVARQFNAMDMRSDRLFWLLYAMGSQLDSGRLNWHQAHDLIRRPETRARISNHQLIYMVHDWVDALESPQQASLTSLMLVCECAVLGGFPHILKFAGKVLAEHAPAPQRAAVIDLLARISQSLVAHGEDAGDISAAIQALRHKNRQVADDDF